MSLNQSFIVSPAGDLFNALRIKKLIPLKLHEKELSYTSSDRRVLPRLSELCDR